MIDKSCALFSRNSWLRHKAVMHVWAGQITSRCKSWYNETPFWAFTQVFSACIQKKLSITTYINDTFCALIVSLKVEFCLSPAWSTKSVAERFVVACLLLHHAPCSVEICTQTSLVPLKPERPKPSQTDFCLTANVVLKLLFSFQHQ